jgi:hypothetical protein
MDHFRKISDEKYEEMFNLGLKKMKDRISILQTQLAKYKEQRDGFKLFTTNFRKLSEEIGEMKSNRSQSYK